MMIVDKQKHFCKALKVRQLSILLHATIMTYLLKSSERPTKNSKSPSHTIKNEAQSSIIYKSPSTVLYQQNVINKMTPNIRYSLFLQIFFGTNHCNEASFLVTCCIVIYAYYTVPCHVMSYIFFGTTYMESCIYNKLLNLM